MAGGRTGRNWGGRQDGADNRARQQLALQNQAQPPRLTMPEGPVARELGIAPVLWKLLTETVYPGAKTVDGILQAVSYCNARKLDVMKRPVHVVPMWSSSLGREVETVWPGIGELRTTASRTGQWAGVDDCVFGPMQKRGFEDEQERTKYDNGQSSKYVKKESCPPFEFPAWAQVTVWKSVNGERVAFVGPKVFFTEAFAGIGGMNVPNAMWRKRPMGQMEKCAEAAALRRAFPEEIGEQYAAEEMEGREWIGHNGGPVMDAEVVEQGGGGASAAAPTRASSAEADEKRAADERFVENTRIGLERATAEQLEKAWKADAGRINALADDLRRKIDAFYDDARKRLGISAPLTDEDIAAYRAEFFGKLRKKSTAAELDAFLTMEADNLDALPEEDQQSIEDAIAEHRELIAAVDQVTDAGGSAPPAAEGDGGAQQEDDHGQGEAGGRGDGDGGPADDAEGRDTRGGGGD